MAYIKGGKYLNNEYTGCTDKTDPEDLGCRHVPYRLYFARKSKKWDYSGVAFLSCEKEPDIDYHAVVRLWKISESQFKDIHEQEGKNWYNKILILEEKNGLETKTITGCWMNQLNPPCQRYLEVIEEGLKETTGWDHEEIKNYLKKFKAY